MAKKVTVPYKFSPRGYQLPILRAMDSGCKRGVVVWHRRAGKDKTLLNLVIKKMFERVGIYYYFFPEYKQGKRALWDGIDREGMKFLDHFPPELVAGMNSTEMKVTLKNGSLFQVIGTDDFDSIRGTNPIGCVFSEYAQQDPRVWNMVIRPVLAENDGWAVFNFTPNGHNHGYEIYNMARDYMARGDEKWFCQLLTVTDTKREDGTPVVTEELIQEDRESGMDEEMIQQEYYCSFEGAIQGSYYGSQIAQAREDGRIGRVPHEEALPVHTFWDLGMDDSTTIWFVQAIGNERRIIDYYENSGEGLSHYALKLQEKAINNGYVYGTHNGPHDLKVRELGTGVSRVETAAKLGINFTLVPELSVDEGIDAVRRILKRCWFDEEKCRHGIAALENYQKTWDAKARVFKKKPKHDWASHGADAFRYFAVGEEEVQPKPKPRTVGSIMKAGRRGVVVWG